MRQSIRTFGRIASVVCALLFSGCYGFAGGGLPPHVRTVAILPFDNQTGEPTLTQEVSEAVRLAMENRLGLRPAAEEQADAVVRGVISSYQADRPLSFSQTPGAGVVRYAGWRFDGLREVGPIDRLCSIDVV